MNVSRRAAERDAETGKLGQSARDQRRAGIHAKAEAVGDAGRYRHDVLHRATDLDANQVGREIDPQSRLMQRERGIAREGLIA